jgi:membrane protein YdbS with pleckstrin-like domain
MAEVDKKAPPALETSPAEPDFSWRWHLKTLAIIYAVLAVLYTIMLYFLAEPDFKWSSQAFNLIVLYALPAVLWGIRVYLMDREKRKKESSAAQ